MKFSIASILFCALLIVIGGSLFYPKWQKKGTEAQISWDASGYYWYLPSLFIYNDLKHQGFKDSIIERYQPTPPGEDHQAVRLKDNNYVMQYSMGVAILEAPFFAIAHLVAKPLGYPADGFSRPYQLMIFVGGIAFALLGLWYLRKLLLLFYSDNVVAIVMLMICAGTNYLNYISIDVGMSHSWLFTLYVLIMWHTHHYYVSGKRKYLMFTAGLIGLATLVRPTEIMTLLLPLFWGLQNLKIATIKNHIRLLWQRRIDFLLAAIIGFLILSIQLCYWKYATGNWLFYTYGEQGFVWFHPMFYKYAFNFECGWLSYTPLLILAIPGLFLFAAKGKNAIVIILLFLINYYIVCSWVSWNIGGRAMIQSYPLLAFPLATLITYIGKRKVLIAIFTPLILLGTYFNLWWTYQSHYGSVLGLPGNWYYYKATFLKYDVPLAYQKLRDNFDLYTEEIKKSYLLYKNNFDEEPEGGTINLGAGVRKSKVYNFVRPNENIDWIRASADFYTKDKEWNVWSMTHFVITFKAGEKEIKRSSIRVQRFMENSVTKNIDIDVKIPSEDYDSIEISFENGSDKVINIDHLKVIGF